MQLPYDPAVVLRGIHPREIKTYIDTKSYTWMFYSSFIHNSQKLEAAKWPSVDEWLNKLGNIHTMEYYAAVKRTCQWIMLGEKKSQFPNVTHCTIPFI